MFRKDPCGYYAGLGVDQLATNHEIKRAFKAKLRQSHPDRNNAPDAAREFQFVNEAYQVLGDIKARANYDARAYRMPNEDAPPAARAASPVVCTLCGRITAQPRYVIYRHVISAVFVTWRAARQSVFCSECGAKCAYRASAKTWLLGWWGIPFGPIYSVQAIYSNLRGGEMPPLNNLRILTRQAIYFAHAGRFGLARAVARDGLRFANRIPEHDSLRDPEMRRMMEALEEILSVGNSNQRATVLKDPWGCNSTAFKAQLGAIVLFAALAVGTVIAIAVRYW